MNSAPLQAVGFKVTRSMDAVHISLEQPPVHSPPRWALPLLLLANLAIIAAAISASDTPWPAAGAAAGFLLVLGAARMRSAPEHSTLTLRHGMLHTGQEAVALADIHRLSIRRSPHHAALRVTTHRRSLVLLVHHDAAVVDVLAGVLRQETSRARRGAQRAGADLSRAAEIPTALRDLQKRRLLTARQGAHPPLPPTPPGGSPRPVRARRLQ